MRNRQTYWHNYWQAQAKAADNDRRMDAFTFIAGATALIALIGHLMNAGLW